MPYVLAKSPTFKTVVKVVEPGNDADGNYQEFQFIVEFKRLDADEFEAMLKSNRPVRVVLPDLVVGWTGLLDASNSEVQFSADHLTSLLKIPHAVVGLWDAFIGATSGAGRKNL